MIRYLPYLLYFFLIGFHEIIFEELTSINGVTINLAALIVCLVAIYKTDIQSAWFGFWVGLIITPAEPATMGWQALLLASLGLAAFHARQHLNMESLTSRLTLVIGGVFVHSTLSLLIPYRDGFFINLWSSVLPGALYTSLIGWLFFLYKDKKLTSKKIKAIF